MGCGGSKNSTSPQAKPAPVQEIKADEDKTLLNATSDKSENVQKDVPPPIVQYSMMQISIKPGTADSIIANLKSAPAQKALGEMTGLIAKSIKKVPDQDTIFIQFQFESDAALQASEAKVGDVLKELDRDFSSAPQRFYAKGGVVQLAGENLFEYKSPEPAKAETAVYSMMRVAINSGTADKLTAVVNSELVQKALSGLEGLKDILIKQMPGEDPTADEIIFIQSQYASDTALQASEAVMASMLQQMEENFNTAPQRFYAKGGFVDLAGETLWSWSTARDAMKANSGADAVPVLATTSAPRLEESENAGGACSCKLFC